MGKTAFAPLGAALADSHSNSDLNSSGEALTALEFDSDTLPRPTRGGLPASVPMSALATLTLAALTIALIEKLQAAPSDAFLIDDTIAYKDLEHGTLLIAPKGGATKGIVLDDPELTVIVGPPDGGFVVQQLVNSSADMALLLAAADAVHFIYQLGQADPFTTGSTQRAETHLFFPDQPNIQLASNPLPLLPPLGDSPNTNNGAPEPTGSNAPPPTPFLLTFSIGDGRVLSHDDTGGVQDTDPDNLPGGSTGNSGSDDTNDPFPIILTGIDGFNPEAMTSRAREGTPADPFINITGAVPGNFSVLVTVEASAQGGVPSGLSVTGGGPIFLFTETTDAGAQVVVGRESANGEPDADGAIAFIVYVTPDGEELWMQESLPIDHGNDGNDFDSIQVILDTALRVRITVSDGTNILSQTIDIGDHVAFEDDGPTAQNDEESISEGLSEDFNIAFVLDFSGSITDAQFNQQKDAVLAAGRAFFLSTTGDVSISMIAFASGAIVLGGSPFTTLSAFEAAVNALDADSRGVSTGGTNYNAALTTTMAHFVPDADANNQVFFISDGNPSAPIASGTATAWNSFVNNAGYDLEVTSIGVGSGIQTGPLQAVDVDGNGAPIMLAGFGGLIQTLLGQIGDDELTGNILFGDDGVAGGGDDDAFGADGGRIQSIVIDGITYVWNGVVGAGSIIDPSTGPNITGTTQLTGIPTTEGGKLWFNFETGAWTYKVKAGGVDGDKVETFTYVIVDGDGDHTSATLKINVEDVPNVAPVAADNSVSVTEGSHSSSGSFAAGTSSQTLNILANDVDRDSIKVTEITPSGGPAIAVPNNGSTIVQGLYGTLTIHSNGTATYRVDNTLAATQALQSGQPVQEVFAYKATDTAGQSATANLTVNIAGANDAPVVWATNDFNFAPGGSFDDNFHLNTIKFADVDSTGDVVVRLTNNDDDDNGRFFASNGGGVVVTGNNTDTMTLTGTTAEINAFIAGNNLRYDMSGTSGEEITVRITDEFGATDQRTISVNDNGVGSDGEDLPDADTFNVYSTSIDLGGSSDSLVTGWNHLGSSATVYEGGENSSTSDTVRVVFTADQLNEILNNVGQQNALRTFLSSPNSNNLDLDASSWNAKVAEFETANLGLAAPRETSGQDNYFNLDTWDSLPAAAVVGAGTNGANLIVGTAAGQTLDGSGGNDVLAAFHGGTDTVGGGNTLNGGSGSDLLLGGDGRDILDGGDGNDLLAGGKGADTFRASSTVGNSNEDAIADYNFAEGDVLDLSALLNLSAGDDISDYVQLTTSNDDILVRVDTGGNRDFDSGSDDLFLLAGANTGSSADPIKILVDNATYAMTV